MIEETVSTEKLEASPAPSATKSDDRRIAGLDTLRAVLAGWVVLGHVGISKYIHPPGGSVGRALLGSTFVGVAAVMAFFVISGFCIHLPYARGRNLKLRSYFVRREVRMLIPVAVAVVLGFVLHSFEYVSVLWSLVCEEIYYAIYPVILAVRRKHGWTPVFAFAIIGSILVNIFGRHGTGNFHDSGYALTWLVAFPIWLLGAVLAEKADQAKLWEPSTAVLWLSRLGIWGTSVVISLIRFHGTDASSSSEAGSRGTISYAIMLVPFGFLVYYWLMLEVAYYRTHKPNKTLETAGKASYTLYLTHTFGPPVVALLGLPLTGIPKWLFTLAVVGCICYILYRFVEAPSHQLARRLGSKIDAPAKSVA